MLAARLLACSLACLPACPLARCTLLAARCPRLDVRCSLLAYRFIIGYSSLAHCFPSRGIASHRVSSPISRFIASHRFSSLLIVYFRRQGTILHFFSLCFFSRQTQANAFERDRPRRPKTSCHIENLRTSTTSTRFKNQAVPLPLRASEQADERTARMIVERGI